MANVRFVMQCKALSYTLTETLKTASTDQWRLSSTLRDPLTEGLLSRSRSIRNAPGEREGMYHRGVEEGGGVAAEETQGVRWWGGGGTEGSFVRQEAAETRAFSLGTVVEQRETWDMRKMARGEKRCD